MKKLIQIWLSLVLSYQVLAQDVNLSTGTASFTLPIYTLQEGSISVPISITYDASGVPTNAIASNVGLNWGLVAGGKIVRTVRRYADDGVMELIGRKRGGIYFYDTPDPGEKFPTITDTERDIFTLMLNGSAVPFIIRYPTGGTAPQIIYLKQNTDISIELVDTQVSPLGDPETNTYTFDQLLNATLGYNLNSKKKFITFKVTTTDGLVYYFGENSVDREFGFTYNQLESRHFLYPLNNADVYGNPTVKYFDFSAATVNSWNLSRIVKPNANDINNPFQEVKFYYKRTQQLIDTYGYNEGFIDHNPTGTCVLPTYSRILDKKQQPIAFLSQLEKIVSNNFEVRFNDNTPVPNTSQVKTIIPDYNETAFGNFADKSRYDIWSIHTSIPSQINLECNIRNEIYIYCPKPNPVFQVPSSEALKNIVVVDKSSSAVKQFGYFLHHSYFNTYSMLQFSNGTKLRNESQNGHLKLLGIYPIKFLGNSGGANTTEILQGHSFKYNNITLPRKESIARDAWGYYNGQDENETLGKGFWINEVRHPYIDSGTQPKFQGSSCTKSNVEPNIIYAQAASLQTIVSPTGGWSELEYELHDCDNYFTERALVNGVPTKIGERKVGGLRIKTITSYDPVTNQTYTKKFTYTKKNSTESSGFLSIWPSVIYNQFSNFNLPERELFAPGVWSQLSSTYINGSYISYRFVKEETIDVNGNNNGYVENEFYNNEIQPYMIKHSSYNALTEDDGTTISKFYDRYYKLTSDNVQTDYNIPKFDFLKNSIKAKRIYDKSGKILSETEYVYEVTDLTNTTPGTDGKIAMVPSETIIQGSVPIKLPWRKELNYVSSGVGYISTGFQIASGNAAAISSSLAAQGVGQAAAGYAIKSISMANIASTLNVVTTVVAVALNIIDIINQIGYSTNDNSVYSWRNYKIPIGKVNLTKTISRTYNMDDANFIETVSEYKYESPNHAQMTSSKNYMADAGVPKVGFPVYENKIKYNKDYAIPANPSTDDLKGLAGLSSLKMITPIESISLKNSKIMSGSYTEFYPIGIAYTGMPKKSYALEITRPLSTFSMSDVVGGVLTKNANYVSKVDYLEYNTRGLLSKVKETNQITESSTQFGYNGYLPTSSTFGTAALNMTTTNEYTPLFGVTKTIAPDNTFVTTTYDELGRVTKIKDFKGDTRKSFDYKTVLPKQPTLDFGFKLMRSVNNEDLIDITDGIVINTSNIGIIPQVPDVNIRIVPPAGIQSVAFELQGPISRNSTDNQGVVWRVFEDANTNGFNILDYAAVGTYKLTAKIYSKPNERGDLIGMKTVSFTIQTPPSNRPQSMGICGVINILELMNIIESGQTQTDEACEEIILKDGFHAKAGSEYNAKIKN